MPTIHCFVTFLFPTFERLLTENPGRRCAALPKNTLLLFPCFGVHARFTRQGKVWREKRTKIRVANMKSLATCFQASGICGGNEDSCRAELTPASSIEPKVVWRIDTLQNVTPMLTSDVLKLPDQTILGVIHRASCDQLFHRTVHLMALCDPMAPISLSMRNSLGRSAVSAGVAVKL